MAVTMDQVVAQLQTVMNEVKRLTDENLQLARTVQELQGGGAAGAQAMAGGPGEYKEKNQNKKVLSENKMLQLIPHYGGKADDYEDWKFKMLVFLQSEDGYSEIFEGIERMTKAPDEDDIEKLVEKAQAGHDQRGDGVKIDRYNLNKQLYQILCLNLKDSALSSIKNLQVAGVVNGFVGWWKLGYENNSMTQLRMQALTSRIFSPKRCKKYAEVLPAIEEWELATKHYDPTNSGKIDDQMRIFAMLALVPLELASDISKSNSLETWEKIRSYIIEQANLRKELRQTHAGPAPMDVDALYQKMIAGIETKKDDEHQGQEESPPHAHGECEHRHHGEGSEDSNDKEEFQKALMSFVSGWGKGNKGGGNKGKGKGKFEGNCHHCGIRGHTASQCWKKDEEMNAYRASKGKGDKGGGKGWYGGGWNKGYGKGKGKNGGKGFGLNLWELNGSSSWGGGGYGGGQDHHQGAAKSAWAMSLEKVVKPPPGLPKPIMMQNTFETLRRNEVEEDFELNQEEFASPGEWNLVEKKNPKMRPMGNYSKGSQKERKAKFKHEKTRQVNFKNSDMEYELTAKELSMVTDIKEKNFKKCEKKRILCPLFKLPVAKALHPVVHTKQGEQGWVNITAVMDSGASESVAPPTMCPHYDIVPSEGSKIGQEYLSASNTVIPNLGEQVLDVMLDDGRETQVKYQIADVSRPLNSITEICDAGGDLGQVVVFGRKGGAVVNLATGNSTPFARQEGVYVMSTWVKPKGFTGPGW